MGPTLIVRIFRATPKPGADEALAARLRTESVALVQGRDGLVSWLAAGPRTGDTERELLFITVWASADAVAAFAGPDISQSVLPDGYAELIERHSVEHLLVLDRGPDPAA